MTQSQHKKVCGYYMGMAKRVKHHTTIDYTFYQFDGRSDLKKLIISFKLQKVRVVFIFILKV